MRFVFWLADILLPYFHQQIRGDKPERLVRSNRVIPWQDKDRDFLAFSHHRHLWDL